MFSLGLVLLVSVAWTCKVFSFDDNLLPNGTILQQQGTGPGAQVVAGSLHLTNSSEPSSINFWVVPWNGSTFRVLWRTYLGPGNNFADGYSLTLGGNPSLTGGVSAEEGLAQGLSACVDTYYWGRVSLKLNGVALNSTGDFGAGYLLTARPVDCSLTITENGLVTFTHGRFTITASLSQNITSSYIIFGARTGGYTEDCWLDDVSIDCALPSVAAPAPVQGCSVSFPITDSVPNGTYLLQRGSGVGPSVSSGSLQLTKATERGSNNFWVIPPLESWTGESTLRITWTTLLGIDPTPGTSSAVGYSFTLGTTPMQTFNTLGEDGLFEGLSACVVTYYYGRLSLKLDGVVLNTTGDFGAELLFTGTFVNCSLTLSVNGSVTFTHGAFSLTTNLSQAAVLRLANGYLVFAARTGGWSQATWISEVQVELGCTLPSQSTASQPSVVTSVASSPAIGQSTTPSSVASSPAIGQSTTPSILTIVVTTRQSFSLPVLVLDPNEVVTGPLLGCSVTPCSSVRVEAGLTVSLDLEFLPTNCLWTSNSTYVAGTLTLELTGSQPFPETLCLFDSDDIEGDFSELVVLGQDCIAVTWENQANLGTLLFSSSCTSGASKWRHF